MVRSFRVFMGLLAFGVVMTMLSGGGYAQGWSCSPSQTPRIHIKTSTENISYDFSKSEKDLNNFSIDTVNPYASNIITDVGGLMRGGITVSQSMRYGTLTNTKAAEICYWYTDIEVTLHINPTIYIASEFPKGSCKHNAIMQHEQQHVVIDRQVVNKYAQVYGETLRNEVSRQQVYGPVPVSRQAEIEAYLKSNMQAIISKLSQTMNEERRQRQQALDNINEYERVNKLCH